MRRYITILFAAAAIHTAAIAQQERLGAKVDIAEFEYHADSVKINLRFDLDELKIGANRSVVFAPKIFKGDMNMELPTVVVQRRGGARSYDRAITLDNTKSIESYNKWYCTPYQIVDYYGSQRQREVNYSLSIPYESWMVESKLYLDCSTCGCCTTEDNGMLIPQENTLLIDIPTIDPYMIMPQVELIKPEKVAIKRRDIAYSSALIFKVNSTSIDPELDRNKAELESIDEMMQSIISDSDYTITKVRIIGYASPEGSYTSNMRLSKGRATVLENLMKRKYNTINPKLYSVEFGGENWDKLYELVGKDDIAERSEVMNIIKNIAIEDGRERELMTLNGGSTYRYLLRNIFPATRLVVVDVEFNVDAYDLDRIEELIDVKPQNLSLEEMYRLSESYAVEDKEFEKIFITAVNIYPDDEVAQNNALVTEIRRDNIDSVEHVAINVDRETNSAELANSLGVYYMMVGDYELAESMLQRASELGCVRAEHNMNQLTLKLENIGKIEDNAAFREKIYGKE